MTCVQLFGNKSWNLMFRGRNSALLRVTTASIREYSVSPRTNFLSFSGSVSSVLERSVPWGNQFEYQNDHSNDKKLLQESPDDFDGTLMTGTSAASPWTSDTSFDRHACWEIDLKEVVTVQNHFDKVLLLVKHGEDESQLLESYVTPSQGEEEEDDDDVVLHDPFLTGRGCGQALDISRTALDAEIVPEVIVVAPLARVIQTALLSFPHYSPASVRMTPWICHPGLISAHSRVPFNQKMAGLRAVFPDIDYSLCYHEHEESSALRQDSTSLETSQNRVLDGMMQWLGSRKEHVVVVSADSEWLKAFCGYNLGYYDGNSASNFRNGEIRAVGILL